MTSPSAILVAAADRIRDLAAAATPGPWRQHDGWWPDSLGVVASVLSGDGNDTDLRALLPTFENEPGARARNVWNDATWIAALSPAVAPHLEVIFRNEAEQYRQLAVAGLLDDPQHAPDPSVLDLARQLRPELVEEDQK